MIDNVIQAGTKYLIENYLFDFNSGPWAFGSVHITAKEVTRYGLPADSVVHLLLIENAGFWTVALETCSRETGLQRFGLAGYFDDSGNLDIDGVRDQYLSWLSGL
jgi:hypothetical protein